ncbi:hypothetical protein [Massilia glaciei]|uniref:Uncharacterized protein n=1 Tax=Massilia glaciei TaxID=1524097 RepID=A0A2U2HEW0_9BURK|nr:hypothetical protein [Massilia glaciei]PWF42430.1 hypothetical protein C7C56_022650 [Massilia glaciei]
MLIWGQRKVYRKKGYVADFCLNCRGIDAHKIDRVGLAFHLYYFTFTEGALRYHRRTCATCKTVSETDVDVYSGFHPTPAPLDVLLENTYPDLNEVVATRLSLELKVLHTPGQLTAQERQAVLFDAFLALSPKVERHYESIRFDLVTILSIVSSIVLLMFVPDTARLIAPDYEGEIMIGAIAVVALFICFQLYRSGGRFMQKKIIPQVADAIRPLRPGDDELRFILETLKQHKHKMGSKLKMKELIAQL